MMNFTAQSMVVGVVLAAGGVLAVASAASAQQYQASILNPAGYTEAFAQGAGSGQQVGFGRIGEGFNPHALLWTGTPASFIDLNPTGFDGTFAYGAGGNQQVGVGFAQGIDRALLWTGTAASYVELTPEGSTRSFGYATDGTIQVGYAGIPETGAGSRAFAWRGTAASAVNLHSPDYDDTTAFDTDGGRIAGTATAFDAFYNAVLWTTTSAESIVSLHRPELFDETVANAIRGTTIGGNGNGVSTGGPNHAIIWLNLGETVVDLHPGPAYFTSFIYAMSATQQVGLASINDGSEEHAAVWSGTAASFTDLHALIPGGPYESSQATGIDSDGSIYGNARNGSLYYAVRWTPVTTPAGCSLADLAGGGADGISPDGIVDGSDFIAFINSFGIGDVGSSALADVAGGGTNGLSPDGIIDGSDFIAFINAFAVGC